jgi:hypothetical protein
VYCRSGYVRASGDPPDGAGDVLLPRVAAQCRSYILRPLAIFKLESSLISPVQDRIHQRYFLSQHPHRSPTKVREIILTQVRAPLFLHLLRAHHCRKTPHYSQPIGSNIPLIAPRYPRGLPLGLDFSRVVGFAANAARCSRARIRQGCVVRFELGRGSCHPPQPRINLHPS